MHDELEEYLGKELDFENEARNCEKCAQNFSGNKRLHVPAVYWDLTTKRILGMEFIHGCKITDLHKIKEMGLDLKDVVGATIEALSEQIYLHGFVHCDPHPGNIFVRKVPAHQPEELDGKGTSKLLWNIIRHSFTRQFGTGGYGVKHGKDFQIVLLDHGLYREVSETVRVNYCQLWKHLILRNDEEVKKYCMMLGVEEWDLFSLIVLMRPYHHDTIPGITIGHGPLSPIDMDRVRGEIQKKFKAIFKLMHQMPRELLLVLRNQNYLRALNKELGEPVNRLGTHTHTHTHNHPPQNKRVNPLTCSCCVPPADRNFFDAFCCSLLYHNIHLQVYHYGQGGCKRNCTQKYITGQM